MIWYEGGIADAVRTSKQKGAIFVVYVEGKDEESTQLTKLINDEQVSEQLQSEHFVAIKLLNNSVPLEQFKQIYQTVAVPSVFFIGKSGAPLEIITGPVSVVDFLEKLKQILCKHGIKITSAEVGEHSDNFIKTEQQETTRNYEVVCKDDVCTKAPSTSQDSDEKVVEDKVDLSPDEKVERAKELVNKTREAKRAQEEAAERLKEIERRKVGQDVQKLKRWQQENDLKELVEERNKEKKEEQAARQRVLDQIAQDKAERAAKFSNASIPPSPAVSTPTTSAPVQRSSNNSNTARLQLRLPDGSSTTHEFPSSDTLQDVHNFILSNMKLPFKSYTLSTTFPRREFNAEENSKTLLELELTPSAVILILPLHGVVAANTNSWLLTFVWSFIGPVLNFVGYVKNRIMNVVSPPSGRASSTGRERKRTTDNIPESSSMPKKRMGETSVIRRQGNVHRLADNEDSDDENNTWNGNSTQQM